MAEKKRVDLSLGDKVKLFRESELPGVTQASLAKKYGVQKYGVHF